MDAKFGFDDNADFRQKDVFALRDVTQEEASEVEAQKYNLNFIKLDGSVGCLVNGAGLAMATMDVLALHGGNPANFLDVGGGATPETVKKAFEIIVAEAREAALLSLVCRQWRRIMLQHPKWWATIHINEPLGPNRRARSYKRIQNYLARSGTEDLSLIFNPYEESSEETNRLLRHLGRIR